MTWSLTGESIMTPDSVEQRTPQSNIFPETISATAFFMFAVRSMNAGTFPEPTPSAGLPELYAARTIGLLPVARITAVSLCFINSFVPSIEGVDMHAINPCGAPARSAASATIRAASKVHFAARGCGLATNPLRPFTEIIALNITVDVGLVEGINAATTPIGSPISTMLFSLSS